MEIHLDLVGGLAGDMFIAGILDALPQYQSAVSTAIESLQILLPVTTSIVAHRDAVLTGKRFEVARIVGSMPGVSHPVLKMPEHEHVSWRTIRKGLENSALDTSTCRHAIEIFSLLAQAEGAVHGRPIEDVDFHEVGAWDSIADIVGAAALITAINASRWTASPAPLGSGRVKTAHGLLAVPAPATVRLLMGMPTLEDGIPGERVTPTGAAILSYLCGPKRVTEYLTGQPRTLLATGNGFGSRELPGLSNHVRVLCFDPVTPPMADHRRLHILEFDVDDQSSEDLATGLDRLRQYSAVLEITQAPLVGKKNRLISLIRVLVRANQLEQAIEGCFRETTTIGLRHYPAEGIALKRHIKTVEVDGHSLRVKVVERPGGRTAKAESDDVLAHENHALRMSLKRRAEVLALADRSIDAHA